MLHVIGCLTQQHDLRLVLLAALLCFFASGTAMSMIARARASAGRMRLFWLCAAGMIAGCGIWGTHFVAMLAFDAGLPVGYDPGLTILSVIIAATLCGLGFALALQPRWAIAGGALTGAAISTMHYVGMAAVRAPADASWDASYVTASVIIGIALSALAMHVALGRNTFRSYAWGALLFALAIVGMHFTAMAAVTYVPDPLVVVPMAALDHASLAFVIAAGAVLIVALGLIGALVDNHLAGRAVNEAGRLRAYIHELEATRDRLEETTHNLGGALEAADAANKSKLQFLAAMSHELRTPLNAILGFSEILGRQIHGPLHERYKEYVQDISKSGSHLLSLINEVLDIARLDAGEVKLDEEVFDVADVITEATRMIAAEAESARIVLNVELGENLPLVRADRRRLRQVLLNLLANAVKFTPEGGWINVTSCQQYGGLSVVVADTGIGMAAKDIPKALERFGQVDSKLSRKYGGVGLGLPLAKQLMELHGGKLEISSTVNVGTTVIVTWPAGRLVAERVAA